VVEGVWAAVAARRWVRLHSRSRVQHGT
jgi:hypothetical protein